MLRRIWSLSIKEFIHLRNDWWMPAFMLFGGVLELLMIGWATSRPITNLPLMILDQNHSAASRQVLTALVNTETFELYGYAESMNDIEYAMRNGDINAAVIIPNDFDNHIADPKGQPTLPVILNGSESIPAREALGAIEGVAREMGEEIIVQRLGIDAEEFAGFSPSLRVWFNESLSEAYYTTPAELALMLEFTTMLFAALAFSRERELGTLEQLLVMPFSSMEIIIGKAIPVIIIGFTDFVIMLAATHFFFGVPVRGSLPLLLVIAIGYLLVEMSKGMVVSVISRTQHQAFLLVLVLGMTDFMFTGYAAPVESMPFALQQIAKVIPAHHWLTILRGIMIKGAGLDVLWPNLAALVAIGTVITILSIRFIRKALN